MNKKSLKLLMVSADYVNGLSLNNIILNPKIKKFKKIFIITSHPSSKIIIYRKYINYYKINTLNEKTLIKKTKELLNILKPDAVLTGINGPKHNIDEAIINLSVELNIRTYSIQNFWGDVNLKYKNTAKTIFVLDKFAAYRTKKIVPTNTNIRIVGSINHENYYKIKINKIKQKKNGKKVKLFFCSQPFLEKNGFDKILIEFLLCIKKFNYEIFFRPHPANSKSFTNKIYNQCKHLNINLKIDKNNNIEKMLSSSDFIVSFFSTVNYDAINLIKNLEYFKIIPVYLFYNIKIKKIFHSFTKLKKIPEEDKMNSLIVSSKREIEKVFDPKFITKNKNRIKKNVFKKQKIKNVSTTIINQIYKDIINI